MLYLEHGLRTGCGQRPVYTMHMLADWAITELGALLDFQGVTRGYNVSPRLTFSFSFQQLNLSLMLELLAMNVQTLLPSHFGKYQACHRNILPCTTAGPSGDHFFNASWLAVEGVNQQVYGIEELAPN